MRNDPEDHENKDGVAKAGTYWLLQHFFLLMLENVDGSLYIHISCPFGCVPEFVYEKIKTRIADSLKRDVLLTTSATHTHYSVSLEHDSDYAEYLVDRIGDEIGHIELKEYQDLKVCYQYQYFDKVGRSRISGQESDHIYLETLSFYTGEKRLGTIIIYNSHPTTLNFNESFLSGAGPAVLMSRLEEKYEGEFFTYMIGAAGDISTRFTRPGQTYEDVLTLCSVVEEAVCKQLENQKNCPKSPLDDMSVEEKVLEVERCPKDMSEIDTSGRLTARELETIELAKEKHKNDDLSKLSTRIGLQRVVIGGHIFIFTPFELFSSYIGCIDKEKATLVNLANGKEGYLSGPGKQKLSFEILGETIPSASKRKLMDVLSQWGGKGEKEISEK